MRSPKQNGALFARMKQWTHCDTYIYKTTALPCLREYKIVSS